MGRVLTYFSQKLIDLSSSKKILSIKYIWVKEVRSFIEEIQRALHSTNREYTFLTTIHGTVSKIGHEGCEINPKKILNVSFI